MYMTRIVWAAIYTVFSIAIGRIAAAAFGLPRWVVSVTAFNNTESLPLLLLQSLSTTGVLASLVPGGEDDGIERARSYVLACSVITNTITFGRGPAILTSSNRNSTAVKVFRWVIGSPTSGDQDGGDGRRVDSEGQRGQLDGQQDQMSEQENQTDDNDSGNPDNSDMDEPDEHTSLLPKKVRRSGAKVRDSIATQLDRWFRACPPPAQRALKALGTFVNPPFVGALAGVVIGVSPPLHRLFFADMADGGYLNAWLSKALRNVGELFVALQVVVVGVKLSLSLRLWKKGEEGGSVPFGTLVCVVFMRFVLWPAYIFQSSNTLFSSDN